MKMMKTYPTLEEAKRIVKEQGINSQKEYRKICKELGLSSNPNITYKNTGWIDWPDFFGRKAIQYPSYEEAQRRVQENGIKTSQEYRATYSKLELPSLPEGFYRGKGWINWGEFLGKKKVQFPTYEEAQRIVQENGVKSQSEYNVVYKGLGLPVGPAKFYKDKGWTNWFGFLGKKKVQFPTYEVAQKIVQEKGIMSSEEYFLFYKELELPSNPHLNYKEQGWVNWSVFLGKEKQPLPSYEEAQRIVKENGIKTQEVYKARHKELGLPAAPNVFYEEEWVDWFDFFGKSRKTPSDERKYRILITLFVNSFLLQDDASVQLIYILVSHLDTKWAKEIEEKLLGTTSFEERLNWVEEQLNKLKDGGTPIHKTTYDTHSDVLSAMESIIGEFDVTDQISTTLENYLHSAVNRELISENDG